MVSESERLLAAIVSERLWAAIEGRVSPQRVERIIMDEGFDIIRDDAPKGWFDLICVKDGDVQFVIRYQWWMEFGWYYDVLDGPFLNDVQSVRNARRVS